MDAFFAYEGIATGGGVTHGYEDMSGFRRTAQPRSLANMGLLQPPMLMFDSIFQAGNSSLIGTLLAT
jgi:hypothetical protein